MIEAMTIGKLDCSALEVDLEDNPALHQDGPILLPDPSGRLHQRRYLSYKKGKQANLDRLKSWAH